MSANVAELDDLLNAYRQTGNQDFLTEIFQVVFPILKNSTRKRIHSMGGTSQDVEDLVQNSLLNTLVLHLHTYKQTSPESLFVWMAVAAKRRALNFNRDTQRRNRVLPPHVTVDTARDEQYYADTLFDSHGLDPEAEVVGSQLAFDFLNVLFNDTPLWSNQRLCLLLKLKGHSNLEVAQHMGITEGAVKSLFHRVGLKMSEALREVLTTNNEYLELTQNELQATLKHIGLFLEAIQYFEE